MIQRFKLLALLVLTTATFGCSKEKRITELEPYLKSRCAYVHEINGFYIVATDQKPNDGVSTSGTTAKEIFEHSVRLFSNFLDQDEDGILDSDKVVLSNGLAQHMLFVSGHLRMVNKISEAQALQNKGLYAMSMQTNKWPYVKDFDGTLTIDKLSSSTWRPENANALWEETFHTITEAYSRFDSEFSFNEGGVLRAFMEADIASGTYDISVQNKEENGNYDKVTAVNEYIYQIWAIKYAGQEDKLNTHQQGALDFMISKGVPMKLNPNYDKMLGNRIKG